MNIGTLWAQIGLDNSQLKSSARESEQVISGMGDNIVDSIKSTVIAGAAAFGVGLGINKIIQEAREAIQAIDSLKLATIQIAAQITTMQGPKDVAQHYADATKYADGLNRKLMEIDANTFANFETLQSMTQVMTMQGVILDYNNKKQVDSFTALSNAVAMYTAGQNQEIQSRQEMNALLSGHVNMNSRLAQQMDGLIKAEGTYKGGLEDVVKLGKQHGDLLERFTPYLVGINAASGDIAKTWEAVTSSAQTAKFMIQAVGFRGLYEDAIAFGGRFVEYLKEHAELIGSGIYRAWLSVKGVVESISLLFQQQDGALRGWTYVIQSIAVGVNAILEGWAFLLSTILPTLIEKFNGIISILNAMVNMGYMFGQILFDSVLEAIKSVGYLSEAFQKLVTGDFAGAGGALKKAFGADFKATMEDNLVVVRGTVAAIKEEYAKFKDTGSFNKRFDAFMDRPAQAGAATVPIIPPPNNEEAQKDDLNYVGNIHVKLLEGLKAWEQLEQKKKDYILNMNREMMDARDAENKDWINLAAEYNKREVEMHALGIYDKAALDDWYAAKAQALQEKQTKEFVAEENKRLAAQKQAEQTIYNMKLSTLQLTAGLLRTMGANSKEAAIAAIAIEKGLAIASIIVNSQAAKFQAMASIPYPASLGAVAQIEAMTAMSIGIVAAQGVLEASSVGGGGGGGGAGGGTAGGPPIQTQDVGYKYFGKEQEEHGTGFRPGEGQGPGKTTIIVQGDVYAQDGDAFKAKVVGAWVDDYKDNGNTRSVAKRYA